MIYLMLGIFFGTLAVGIPIAVGLGVAGFILLLIQGFPPLVLIQKMYLAQQSFLLLAIPLFILAGELMVPSGILAELLRLINLLVGRFRGGLGHVVVLGSMIFSGTSGSAIADASAIGAVMIPMTSKQYKDSSFAACITGAASTIGPIIPPSIPMIFYSLIANVSIIGLFLAGIIPGILMGIGLMIMVYLISLRRKLPVTRIEITSRELLATFIKSLPILLMPIVVVGGIVAGIFTATEAAAVAVVYVVLVGTFLTKKLRLHHFPVAFMRSAIITTIVFLILSTSTVVAFEFTVMDIPEIVSNWFLSVTSNVWVFLAFVNIFFLFIGMIIEPIPAMIMLVPIFEPVALSYGVDPIHFGFVVVLNLIIGLLTPPVGPTLYICGSIGKLNIEKMSKEILPWVFYLIFILLLTTYVPQIVLWIPRMMGY